MIPSTSVSSGSGVLSSILTGILSFWLLEPNSLLLSINETSISSSGGQVVLDIRLVRASGAKVSRSSCNSKSSELSAALSSLISTATLSSIGFAIGGSYRLHRASLELQVIGVDSNPSMSKVSGSASSLIYTTKSFAPSKIF